MRTFSSLLTLRSFQASKPAQKSDLFDLAMESAKSADQTVTLKLSRRLPG
jgi:hypothetical protein